MFNGAFIRKIMQHIDDVSDLLDVNDFETQKTADFFTIRYAHMPSCYIRFASLRDIVTFECSPGQFLDRDSGTGLEDDGVFSQIEVWIDSLEQEIRAQSDMRTIQNKQNEYVALLERFKNVPDKAPNREEITQLHQRLANLQQKLIDQLKAQKLKDDELEKRISNLETTIQTLMVQAETTPSMRKFFGSVYSKLKKFAGTEEGQKLLEGGEDMIRGFLE